MNKARVFGPVLMILLGLAVVAGPAQSSVDVGTTIPCEVDLAVGVFNPCEPDPCQQAPTAIGVVAPCRPTRTSLIETTTTTTVPVETTTTEPVETTTTEPAETTTSMATTSTMAPPSSTSAVTPSSVAGVGGGRGPATANSGGALARTGSDSGPLTAVGITLAGLGVVLLVAERRRAAARA